MGSRSYGKVAWILDGGGFKAGPSQIGIMRTLIKSGIKPDYLQTVSVGTANGAKMMAGNFTEADVEELENIWMFIKRKGASYIFRKVDMVGVIWHPSYIFKDKGLRNLFDGLNIQKIMESPIEFRVATRNLSKGNIHTLFSNHDERFKENPYIFLDVLRASMSIPGFFPQVDIFGEFYGDGLTYSIVDAIKAGCDTIFIMTINHGKVVAHPEKEECWHQIMVPFNTVLDELNRKVLREDLSDSTGGVSDFKILDVSSVTPPSLWDKFIHGVSSFIASISRGDNPSFVPHLIVPIIAEVPAGLSTYSFQDGDKTFRLAIDKAVEQTSRIIGLLEK